MKDKSICPTSKIIANLTKSRPIVFILLVLIYMLYSTTILGQTLEDFKTAALNNEGPNLIPFYDLRRDATSIADEVQYRKSLVALAKYDEWKPRKENILDKIKTQRELIKKENEIMAQYKIVNPDGSIDCMKADVTKQERIIVENNDKRIKLDEEIKSGLDAFERLSNARGGLREYFDDALKLLTEARSNSNKYIGDPPLKLEEPYLTVPEPPAVVNEPTVSEGEPTDEYKHQLDEYNEYKRKLAEHEQSKQKLDEEYKRKLEEYKEYQTKLEKYEERKKNLENYIDVIVQKIQGHEKNHKEQEVGSENKKMQFKALLELRE